MERYRTGGVTPDRPDGKTNVALKDGETIGFSADEKLPITLSKGVALEGDTLKIGYRGQDSV